MNTEQPIVRKTFNLNYIKETITKLQDLINTMKLEGKYDMLDHELEILNKYPEFYDSYPFLVKKVCKGGDLNMLDTMFKNLEKVESGDKSLETVEHNLGNKLASQYLNPINK
jgi:hypothetical protein